MKVQALALSFLLAAGLVMSAGAAVIDFDDPDAMLPVDLIINSDSTEIRKVYDLSPNTDPSALPRDSFDREGFHYACSDILREVIIGAETQNITQKVSIESASKEMDAVLELLPQDKEIVTEDGFEGTLHLVLSTVNVEPSGYGTTTKAITASRKYPNLASADTEHLPKTIEEGNKTLTLKDVQWQTDNTYNADDYEIGDRFTAVCTYGGTQTLSFVKGYNVTADYSGEAYRTGVTVIRYTVIFTGTPIRSEEPAIQEPERPSGLNPLTLIPAILLALAVGAGGTYILLKIRKEHEINEEMDDGRDSGPDAHDGDDAGSGADLPDRRA